MRNPLKFSLLVLFLFVMSPAIGSETLSSEALSEVFPNDEIRITMRHAEIITWPADSSGADAADSETVLAVTLEVANQAANKKVDVSSDFILSLRDEFDNTYRLMSKPLNFPAPTFFPNKNYPSLYPNDILTQIVFFEHPVITTQNLFLEVIPPWGMNKEKLTLRMPTGTIDNFSGVVKKRDPNDADIRITTPNSGTRVNPGNSVFFQVALDDDIKKPDKIYLLSPGYVFEDTHLAYRYDVRIPVDQKPGPFQVAAMAEWQGERNKDNSIFITNTVTLEVIDPQEECIEDCRNSGGSDPGDLIRPSEKKCPKKLPSML